MLTLELLDCSYTKISKLPIMPNLIELYIDKTKVPKLDYYKQLETLSCSRTQITELPYDMPNLFSLYCDHTKISKLPYIPKIQHLSIKNTLITELPEYDMPNLETMHINETKISRLPDPDKCCLQVLYLDNTYVSMLPFYPQVWELGSDDEIFTVPQYISEWDDPPIKLKLLNTLIKCQKNVKFQIYKRIIRRVGIVLYRNSKIYDLNAACKFADRVVEFLYIPAS